MGRRISELRLIENAWASGRVELVDIERLSFHLGFRLQIFGYYFFRLLLLGLFLLCYRRIYDLLGQIFSILNQVRLLFDAILLHLLLYRLFSNVAHFLGI